MRRVLSRAQAIKAAIIVIVAIAVICIFPLRIFDESFSTTGAEHPSGDVAVSAEAPALQEFKAEYDHIASIGFFIRGEYYDDLITVRVFKEDTGALLREVTVSTDELKHVDERSYSADAGEGYADVYINLDTEVGDGYFYTIESLSTDLTVLFETTGNSGASNNGYMQYAGETRDAYNLMSRYTYKQPLRKTRSLLYIAVLIAAGALLVWLTGMLEKRVEALKELCSPVWIIRVICNPLIIAGTIAALVAILPLHIFSIYIADMIIMSLGVLLAAAILLYAVNILLPGSSFDPAEYLRTRWQSLAQALCIALALWACVEYMNALYEVFHDSAWRKMVFFLGLSLIVTLTYSEAVNLWNLGALVIGVAAARIYYVTNLPAMVDEYHTDAMLWTCRLFPVILILIVYIVRTLVTAIRTKHVEARIISIPYAAACVIIVGAMVVRRHLDYWPVMLAVCAGVIAFRFLFWERRAEFIGNVLNGILFHFGGCVIYCLLHRPYDFNVHVRYPFVFHTATITAEYLALVMAAALVKLFSKYRRTREVSACRGEMLLMGMVTTYMLFTMSRTAMIGVVAAGLVTWIAYSYRTDTVSRLRTLLASAGMFLISAAVAFPIFFSAQKAIPALVGEPHTMIVEQYSQDLLICDDPGAEGFITFTRFVKAFANKMLGVSEDRIKWDRYTIYGVDEDMYLTPSQLAEMSGACLPREDSAEPAGDTDAGPAVVPGVLLCTETAPRAKASQDAASRMLDNGFEPPHEYSGEGDPPPQWWDEDYWLYEPETGEWSFNVWKLEQDTNRDVTNGRTDIYRAYYEQLTPEGHEEMGALLPDGSIAAHAHNIYLQIAYDHGIIVGIMFIIWCMFTCIQALMVFIRHRDQDPAAGTVLAVSVTYAVCGITEWISHPCNPVGMIMFILAVPMAMYRYGHSTDETV